MLRVLVYVKSVERVGTGIHSKKLWNLFWESNFANFLGFCKVSRVFLHSTNHSLSLKHSFLMNYSLVVIRVGGKGVQQIRGGDTQVVPNDWPAGASESGRTGGSGRNTADWCWFWSELSAGTPRRSSGTCLRLCRGSPLLGHAGCPP